MLIVHNLITSYTVKYIKLRSEDKSVNIFHHMRSKILLKLINVIQFDPHYVGFK